MDIGGLPSTLINFVSRRQPLAVAYLRDYLESTTVCNDMEDGDLAAREDSSSWNPVLFRK